MEAISFPSEEQHRQAWETLAKNIANTRDEIQSDQSTRNLAAKGELTIIGSGIQSLNFIRGDEALIKMADVVFFCVADPATVTWIKTVRPDAYDLYVLYANHKVRYTTYMQMTEAMLYYVRQGKKVVAIYYGHPGIFALSPHRAILIAKREGHKAIMKPGISALDCLCADLGVDPAHPGLQTHEATDVLIRNRILDTSLHVVLWQVGLIGDQGFRDQGYINQHFPIFIEYLQNYYGENYPITHYIASRYPTVPPVIEVYTLNELYNPKVRLKINGISTFYLAPQKAMQTDINMLLRLGIIKPGQMVTTEAGTTREIGHYGRREMLAFHDFKHFKVPSSYHWQANQPASHFLIRLQDDLQLQAHYERDPESAVATFSGLTAVERRLLALRESNPIQAVAKGLVQRSAANETFLQALFANQYLLGRLLKVIKQSSLQTLKPALDQWAEEVGYSPNWSTLYKSLARMTRERLYLWTGIYCAKAPRYLITIGVNRHTQRAPLHINGQAIQQYQFSQGVLEWSQQAGIQPGLLRLDVDRQGWRRLIGSIGSIDPDSLISHTFFMPEMHLGLSNNVALTQKCYSPRCYDIKIPASKKQHSLTLDETTIRIDGIAYLSKTRHTNYLSWCEKTGDYPVGQVIFFIDPITLTPSLLGSLQNAAGKKFTCYGKATVMDEVGHLAEPLFELPSSAWTMLVNQCKQDRDNGPFLWFRAYKIQNATRVIYALLNRIEQ